MFESLSDKITSVFDKLKRRATLSESDISSAMREIRVALLEADVALPVVKSFIEKVKEKALGQEVIRSVTPGQMIVKIVNDEMVELLGKEAVPISLNAPAPVVFLLVGLQGSGKTTSTAKLAKYLKEKEKKKVLMASLDVYRPAAQKQLEVLGQQVDVQTVPIIDDQKPEKITKRAIDIAQKEGYDILLLDTAGRLHIDQELMDEVQQIKDISNPTETLLVSDSMLGQDAVNSAKSFHEAVKLTGLIMTRIDGDARGGAALSVRHVTECPIKFFGTGEKLDALEVFHPDRIVNRILGMGDVVSLVEKAAENFEEEEAEKLAKKIEKGRFDLNDLAKQFKQLKKMGGLSSMMNMLPGAGKIKKQLGQAQFDDNKIKRQEAILSSMTPLERSRPELIKASRKKRIAAGSGTTVVDVNKLLKQFFEMNKMMKRLGKMKQKGQLPADFQDMMGKNPFQ